MKHQRTLMNAGRVCGLALLTASVVTACGGGGSNDSHPTPSSTAAPSRATTSLAPAGLVYTPESSVYKKGDYVDIAAHASGGAITNFTISPALPKGLALDAWTGEITGYPSEVSSARDYTVTASNSAGKTTAHLRIEVKEEPALRPISLHYPNVHLALTQGTPVSMSPTTEGGALTDYEVQPSLPDGLYLNPKTGEIYGTPTRPSGAEMQYVVNGYSADGSHRISEPVALSIKVAALAQAPKDLTYDTATIVATQGFAIPADKPRTAGGQPAGYRVAPPLPDGMTINETTGEISGTPLVERERTAYHVTAYNKGGNAETIVQIEVQAGTIWQPVNSPKEPRSQHTATLLRNDELLIAGGRNASGQASATAEIYDAKTNQWSAAKAMSHAREGATAFAINGGAEVLVFGGTDGKNPVDVPELYDRATNTWTALKPIPHPRLHATITLAGRNSDKVLIAGGYENGVSSPKVDVYDMITGAWTDGAPLKSGRAEQAAARLPNGQVLIVGGVLGNAADHQYATNAELYDVDNRTSTQLSSGGVPRREPTATLLQDGHVLVTGGFTFDQKFVDASERNSQAAELYDAAGQKQDLPKAFEAPIGVGYEATVMQNGLVLFTGGDIGVGDERRDSLRFAQLYDPRARTWRLAASMPNAREHHTATAVGDSVIVIGGDHFVTHDPTSCSRTTVPQADKFSLRNPKP